MKIINQYNLQARWIPCFLCILPIFVLYFFFLDDYLSEFSNFLKEQRLISGITVLSVMYIFMHHFIRLLGKIFFENTNFAFSLLDKDKAK